MTVYYRDKISTVELRRPTSSNTVDATLKPTEFTWSLDESAAPYVTAALTIPPPSIAVWAKLDPALRAPVAITEFIHRSPVDFVGANHGAQIMLRIYSRTRNDDNSVALTLVGPEQDLIDYFPAAVDRSNWANQADVALVIRNVLNRVYGVNGWIPDLPAGGEKVLTGSFTTYQAATNLVKNPRLGVDSTGWNAVGTGGTLSRGTNANASYPFQNYARLGIGTGSTLSTGIAYVQASSFTPGQQYGFSIHGNVTKQNVMAARLIWSDASGNEVGARSYAPATAIPANQWRRFAITATAPVGAASFSLTFYAGGGATAWVSGDVIYATAVLVVEGNGIETDGVNTMTYFDGDSAPGLNGYSYTWQDTANGSPSTRTPTFDRDPDTLTWTPGQSAWDFLAPILEALGGRLFSRGGYGVYSGNPPTAVFAWVSNRDTPTYWVSRVVEGDNLYGVTQVSDLGAQFSDGTPMFADAVVIHYTWTDSTGVAREAYDAYPTSGYTKPWLRELNEPYPGRGRAQGLYLRLRARASMLELVTAYDPLTQPSTQVSVTSARLGGNFLGIVDSVEHDPYNGRSTIRTKSTISYPTNAWITKTTPWSALAGTWAAQ